MRSTGNFYYFNLGSISLSILSSLLMVTWGRETSRIRLWLDILPSGFGSSASITATLIVSESGLSCSRMQLIVELRRLSSRPLAGRISQSPQGVCHADPTWIWLTPNAVSYLFRTTGQVVGVAASGAILQSILLQQLRRRITGPGAADTIAQIRYRNQTYAHEIHHELRSRHSTTIIPSLDPQIREAAVASYAAGLKAVFLFQAALAFLALLASLPIEENPLPGSPEEQAEQDAKRRLRQGSSSVTIGE